MRFNVINNHSLHADLIVAILSYVAHPWKSLIARLFNDLKVPDLHPADREVGNFELDLDRDTAVLLALLGLDRREPEASAHHEFFATRELLD